MKYFFIIFMLCFTTINAQKTAENQLGSWFMYNGSHRISEKYSLQTMAHLRYFEVGKNFQQEIYRFGINYIFNPKVNVTVGYSYVNTDEILGTSSKNIFENRIYEDLNLTNKWSDFKLRHRIRLEHRFLHTNIKNNWFRYDLNINYPISEQFSVYAFNEIFFHLDRQKRFVQNWTGFGTLYKINNAIKLNFGYFQIKLPNDNLKRFKVGILINTEHFST